ncbi:hypothetical protein DXG01_014649, partial [Tephrocybe rancida]
SHTTTHEACHVAHHTGHPHNNTGANRNDAEQRGRPGNDTRRTRPHRYVRAETLTRRRTPAHNMHRLLTPRTARRHLPTACPPTAHIHTPIDNTNPQCNTQGPKIEAVQVELPHRQFTGSSPVVKP